MNVNLPERLREIAALMRVHADELEEFVELADELTVREYFYRFQELVEKQDYEFGVLEGRDAQP